MLDAILQFSLRQRLLVIAVALALSGYGLWTALSLPIDVFPDLDRPRVVIMTEAPGMAPEETETRVTFLIETAMNGGNGVQAVRSTSSVGLSVVYVEFNFGTNVYTARQIVNERLAMIADRLPKTAKPQLAPISSIMGQILVMGMWSADKSTDPIELRTQADWIIRQRILSIPGVAQVFVMGGGRKQFQVQIDQDSLIKYGVTIEDIKRSVENSNENATGGYLDQRGPNEWLVRAIGRIQSIEDLNRIAVTIRNGRPVSLAMVANVVEAPQLKRGDAAAYVREENGQFSGGSAVVLTVSKQPGADTRGITKQIEAAIQEVSPSLAKGIRIESLYAQEHFIDRAIENVLEALRDGGILVVIILFLFLMNFRTTFISLTAIPLSLLMTVLVFHWFGFSINTMTLGGLAVAIGELVDDAIVDVENIFRRLKENAKLPVSDLQSPMQDPSSRILYRKSNLRVVYEASLEVRSSIVFSTIIVCLVFLPLFALSGMEGRMFAPLGVAYVVSILSSLLVSLTVTPILSYWLLPSSRAVAHATDSFVLRFLKWIVGYVIRFSLQFPVLNIVAVSIMVGVAAWHVSRLDRDFLPDFNEGAIQLNVLLPPGTSLATCVAINKNVEEALVRNSDVVNFVRRTGRAELDEHAEPVSASEYIVDLDPKSLRTRAEQLEIIRNDLNEVPGIFFSVEQPISHLISHMLSGVKAQVGVKLYGDDLDLLRRKAEEVKAEMQGVRGVKDLIVEQQTLIPQLKIEYNRDKLLAAGLTVEHLNRFIETAMNGQVVSEVMQGQRTFDLVVRLKEDARENLDVLRRLPVELPGGGKIPLEAVANIYESLGPNTIQREKIRRRIVIQCNTANRGLVEVVEEIQERLKVVRATLPQGYYFEYSGQFESQQSASKAITWLFGIALVGVFLTLYAMFRSVNLSLQVMAAIPMAFIGSVAAIVWTGQNLTIASMVGFISLGGIASRNGILLLQHYLHLVKHEGETWSREMIVRAGLERLAPVLMTALTAGIGLVPLVLAAGQPGKEILYPVATVILGGVISSTLLDFFVHPALFWLFGIRSAQRAIESHDDDNFGDA
ncbi:MAG: efflux RND transporter permease subunit [Pirellula sp.]